MNPYMTVSSPNYAAPLMQFGLGQQQQGQQRQGNPQNQQQWAQALRQFLGGIGGQQQPGQPLQLGAGITSTGAPGGTSPFPGGSSLAIY